MRAEEKRFYRLNLLAKYWNKPNVTKEDLFNRALRIGVTEQTARSYINIVLQRYPKKIVE